MKKKYIIAISAALLIAAPLFAVFSEKNLGQTLHVLRFELQQEYTKRGKSELRLNSNHERQHFQMVSIMKRCNELALMLYSQRQDFTFDMTYALKEVTQEYNEFNKTKVPYDQIVDRLDIEIDRYSRLIESLRRLPPQLSEIEDLPDSLAYHNDSLDYDVPSVYTDEIVLAAVHDHSASEELLEDDYLQHDHTQSSDADGHDHELVFELDEQGIADRDSCVRYATALLKMYAANRAHIIEDSENYEDTSKRLKESYDYAQERYHTLQQRIFVNGQDSFLTILKSFRRSWETVKRDVANKYGARMRDLGVYADSEWKGPKVLQFTLLELIFLVVATLLSVIGVRSMYRHVKLFSKGKLSGARTCITALLACVLYAAIIQIASWIAGYGFFKVASELFIVYVVLTAAILLSLLVRFKPEDTTSGMKLYLPMMMEALVVIVFRVIFIPNSLMNMIFPPLLLIFFLWQLHACLKHQSAAQTSDQLMSWGALAINGIVFVMSMIGYGFVGVITVIWWFFQAALIETLMAIHKLLILYKHDRMTPRLKEYRDHMRIKSLADTKGGMIRITWFYDFAMMTVIPVLAVLSVPFCIQLALNVFDFKELCATIFTTPFFDVHDADGNAILHISVYKSVVAVGMFFLFRYISYVSHAIYQAVTYSSVLKGSDRNYVRKNEVNLSLGNSLISILVWFLYIVIIIVLLKIPTGAVTVIATGLSAGIGLAMKDVLNNFIYGIQLMSGRLRVGDWVECDGIRGKVSAIGYQSTQIETIDGAVMSFLNTSLFNKNFKNLTRNNSFEFVKIVVGVKYGTEIELVREKLLEALDNLEMKDSYGRDVVDRKRGITIVFEEFGDSSVDIAIKQHVLVSERAAYIAKAKETVYNTLNANNIEIPFPQRDIHVKSEDGDQIIARV